MTSLRRTRYLALVLALVVVPSLVACSSSTNKNSVTAKSERNTEDRRKGFDDAPIREILWAGCSQIVALTDSELETWRSRGVTGFVCSGPSLRGLGGDQDFVGAHDAPLVGSTYDLQRAIRDSRIVQRSAARGIVMWLGIRLVNFFNPATPLVDWFDDAGWSKSVLPRIADVAGAARALGFVGLAFDGELYPQEGGRATATWDWNYPGNSHSESAVRAEVRQRGAQVMRAIVDAFPGAEIVDYYDSHFQEGWNELVQERINHVKNSNASNVQINLWDGLTSVPGYGPIRLLDATFYKTMHVNGASWDGALAYNVNRLTAYLSRHLQNWSYASSKIDISPFAWIDGDVANEGPFTAARDPQYVADQLAAFRRWSVGGAFGIYAYGDIRGGFDYEPYAEAMRAAAHPRGRENDAPTLTVTRRERNAGRSVVSGTAMSDTAITSISWEAGATHGVAPMTWVVTRGDYRTGYRGQMNWAAEIPTNGPITLTARDLMGGAATISLP